ncbi:MAG: (deoxy)nucleoside triphosphate pyrophosphohydrolase [Phycisphaerales bacterium]
MHKISAPPRSPVRVGIAIVLDPAFTDTLSYSKHTAAPRPTQTHPPRVLITKREPHTPYGGFWEFPGGKVEPDEPIPHAIIRECLEELGVRIAVGDALPPFEHRYEHASVHLHAAIATLLDPESTIAHLGVADHRWVTLDEIPWLEFLPANVRLITRLVRWLETHAPAA